MSKFASEIQKEISRIEGARLSSSNCSKTVMEIVRSDNQAEKEYESPEGLSRARTSSISCQEVTSGRAVNSPRAKREGVRRRIAERQATPFAGGSGWDSDASEGNNSPSCNFMGADYITYGREDEERNNQRCLSLKLQSQK